MTPPILAADAAEYPVAYTPADGVLVALGFLMVLSFMALIMTRRLTPMVALIVVPTVFGLIAGAGLGLGDMVIDAISKMAPTAALLMFAIMYFGIMIDVGLFDQRPGLGSFAAKDVISKDRRAIRSGEQTIRIVSRRKPAFAGVDPYNLYVDRNGDDNVVAVSSQ